jgi:hypothetical protein
VLAPNIVTRLIPYTASTASFGPSPIPRAIKKTSPATAARDARRCVVALTGAFTVGKTTYPMLDR